MVYRPTVRYADVYEKYIKQLDEATHLDRNQLIRLALFVSAYSIEYRAILERYKKADSILPQAGWGQDEDDCWRNQNFIPRPKKVEICDKSKLLL